MPLREVKKRKSIIFHLFSPSLYCPHLDKGNNIPPKEKTQAECGGMAHG